MFTIYDVKNRDGYFCECAKQAFSLLRFSTISEVLKIEKDCKRLIADIAEDLSEKVHKANTFIDMLSKNVLASYLPSLEQDAEYSKKNSGEKHIDAISPAIDRVSMYVTNKIDPVGGGIDVVAESATYIEPNISDYGFRDALQITNIAKKMYGADEHLTKIADEKNDEVETKYGVYYEKYNNEVVNMISEMRASLNQISNLKGVIDSCLIAKYLRSYYELANENTAIDFLNCSEFELINKAAEASEHFMKEE